MDALAKTKMTKDQTEKELVTGDIAGKTGQEVYGNLLAGDLIDAVNRLKFAFHSFNGIDPIIVIGPSEYNAIINTFAKTFVFTKFDADLNGVGFQLCGIRFEVRMPKKENNK